MNLTVAALALFVLKPMRRRITAARLSRRMGDRHPGVSRAVREGWHNVDGR
jgi:hypothetical protein